MFWRALIGHCQAQWQLDALPSHPFKMPTEAGQGGTRL